MKEFEHLKASERELLYRAPALVSLLAASLDGEVSEKERTEAVKLAHLRTFTSEPVLHPYYEEVEKVFESQFDQMHRDLPTKVDEREHIIQEELKKLNPILQKLDNHLSRALRISLRTYAKHVSKAQRNALQYFILPFDFDGITD
jgi:hypothetical protein